MMETSTPQRSVARRSLLNVSMVSSPLRKSMSRQVIPLPLDPVDDEKERSNRRSMVAMQRRLTNITSANLSPLVDTNPIIEENQIKDHLRICAKLYVENRISAKNAWQLHVIDVMRRIASTGSTNVLQVAGSSLDIGAKVYGLRVDDVHAKGLQLASSMSKSNENKQNQNDGEELDANMSVNEHRRRRNVRKKMKKMASDKRNTVDKEQKTLYASIKHVESVVFATKENIEVCAIDNLFTHKLPTNPANHQLMVLNMEKCWSHQPDEILDKCDKLLDIEIPQVYHDNICLPFKDFETGTWDPEEDERLLAELNSLPEVVLDENGIPIAELDGSIHDIFEDNNDLHIDPTSDTEEQQEEVFNAQIHGEIAHIIDAVPEENRMETEYGYNTLVMTTSGKYIDKIWAGPSHWKVKFNRQSSARYSGSTVQHVKHARRAKVPQTMNFFEDNFICRKQSKYVVKRAPGTTSFEKITLPVPELSMDHYHKLISQFLIKPQVQRPRLNNAPQKSGGDFEVQVYNYENPNDSFYCSQNNNDDANDEPMTNSFEEELPPAAQGQFLSENLVNAPEMVYATHLPYAMQAKKMDMKKLKNAIWKCLNQRGEHEKSGIRIKPTQFSTLYETVPQLLSADMKKELTLPLALVALLHLCNENDLELRADMNFKDCTIIKAKDV